MQRRVRGAQALAISTLALGWTLPHPANAQAAVACSAPARAERPWLDRNLSAECRADLLVRSLDGIDAKLKALAASFADQGIARAINSDGPVGPTDAGDPISLASPLAIAATFDPDLAAQAGTLVGREFRAAGMTRMLGPTLDVARTWHYGRTPETFGEDPVLITRISTPYVRAIQAEGVASTLKHYAVYSQEQGRTGDLPIGLRPAVNVVVSEKTMRELYLPAFRSAVIEAGALGAMCSFPRINGTYACEHPQLLGILKQEWGLRGLVTPDFPDAQRSVVAAVNAGLDVGNFGLPRPAPSPPSAATAEAQPAGPPPGMLAAMGLDRVPGGITLEQAVRSGQIPIARLDDLLRRVLVTQFALDSIPATPVDPVWAKALAQRLATDGAVLLRNQGGILPLAPDVRSLAVIGTQAGDRPEVAVIGSANIPAKTPVSALAALRAKAGGRTIAYAEGNGGLEPLPGIPPALLHTPDGAPGLRAEYAANPNFDFAGPLVATRVEAAPESRGAAPIAGLPPHHQWSARWTGTLTPRATGLHRFTLSGAGSARLVIDGQVVARYDRVDFGDIEHAALNLTAGRSVAIRVDYTPREAAPMPVMPMMATTLGGHVRIGLAEPDDRIAQAVAAARAADVAVVFAANRQGEGADRTLLNLPPDQDALIAAVTAANPRTVVVLGAGSQIAMPWRDKVAGILQLWYAGEAFGPAAAALILGEASPGGRLPVTFPGDPAQGPGTDAAHYPGSANAQGELTDVRFDEGTLVGYRWHLGHPRQKPLYPFGYGLSYGDARLSRFAAAPRKDGAITVTAQAANRGSHRAVEVIQAYVVLPGKAGQSIPKLAGFTKVALEPGEMRSVEMTVPATAFDYWDEDARAWRTWDGRYELRVGRSAAVADFRKHLTR